MKGDIETLTRVMDSSVSENGSSTASASNCAQASSNNNGTFRHELDNIADLAVECPLCMENLDIDDIDFFPCSCGYQVCRFCWHRLKNDENGLCPACRQPYPDSPIHFSAISIERVEELKKQKKKQKEKQKLKDSNKANLSTIRVVQKNLLFVIGFSQRLSQEDLRKEFVKYGKIIKMVINSTSAYVTYTKAEDAVAAIKALNEMSVNANLGLGKNGVRSSANGINSLRASLGTTKYCTHWLRCQTCPKQPDCMYLHEIADQEASFTKEEMQLGKHTEYEKRLISYYLDVIAKEKEQKDKQSQQPSNLPFQTQNSNVSKHSQHSTNYFDLEGGTESNYNSGISNDASAIQSATALRNWNDTNYNGHQSRNYHIEGETKGKPTSQLSSSSFSLNGINSSNHFSAANSGSLSGTKNNNSYKKNCDPHENVLDQLYHSNGMNAEVEINNKESSLEVVDSTVENSMKSNIWGGVNKTEKNQSSSKISTAIKINKIRKANVDSDSSSGNSSLSSTPNQVEPSVFASYCSSSSSSGTSSLNLCDNSDSGNSSSASTSTESNSSTPDTILQKQKTEDPKVENDGKTNTGTIQSSQTENQTSESALHDTNSAHASTTGLLQDDDDDLDFDPISLSSRALEDMVRSMTIGGAGLVGNHTGHQGFTENYGSTSLAHGSRINNNNQAIAFHQTSQQQQQQQSSNNMFEALLGVESTYSGGKSNSFAGNISPLNGSAFSPFVHMQQQQQQRQTFNHQQTSPPTAASILQQQHLLEQLQQLQHQRQHFDLQQKLLQQTEKNLFGSDSLFTSHHQQQQQQQKHSSQVFRANQQPQNSQTKLWQQNSLRQLLPNVNIKFQQQNLAQNAEDVLSGSFGGMGLNTFGSSCGMNNLTQSLSPSALNVAAAASFFGSGNVSNQSQRSVNQLQPNSSLLGNGSPYWQANGGQQSSPHPNNTLTQQQQQLLRMQQQQRSQQQQQQNSNFNSFFMNQFFSNNLNGGSIGNTVNRPPPGF